MESARVAFYLFDELVAKEEELYDKRVKNARKASDWD